MARVYTHHGAVIPVAFYTFKRRLFYIFAGRQNTVRAPFSKTSNLMENRYITGRLIIEKLSGDDSAFIFNLLNTDGWLKFIGDRNVKSEIDAKTYIKKILGTENLHYWTVRLKDDLIPVGIVTFIKREYLNHHDIGFAFLPEYSKKGYAFEAATTILNDIIPDPAHTHILATTVKENTRSIRLLEKLGLRFEKEIENNNERLLLYSASTAGLLSPGTSLSTPLGASANK